jgi:hypothetical protein
MTASGAKAKKSHQEIQSPERVPFTDVTNSKTTPHSNPSLKRKTIDKGSRSMAKKSNQETPSTEEVPVADVTNSKMTPHSNSSHKRKATDKHKAKKSDGQVLFVSEHGATWWEL